MERVKLLHDNGLFKIPDISTKWNPNSRVEDAELEAPVSKSYCISHYIDHPLLKYSIIMTSDMIQRSESNLIREPLEPGTWSPR